MTKNIQQMKLMAASLLTAVLIILPGAASAGVGWNNDLYIMKIQISEGNVYLYNPNYVTCRGGVSFSLAAIGANQMYAQALAAYTTGKRVNLLIDSGGCIGPGGFYLLVGIAS